MSDVFDAVSELLDKQLFSDSKSDIVTNVVTRREGASLLFSPIRPRSTHHYQCDVT